MLECSNDIVFIFKPNAKLFMAIINNDRKGWPDIQIPLDRSSVCNEKLEIETVW